MSFFDNEKNYQNSHESQKIFRLCELQQEYKGRDLHVFHQVLAKLDQVLFLLPYLGPTGLQGDIELWSWKKKEPIFTSDSKLPDPIPTPAVKLSHEQQKTSVEHIRKLIDEIKAGNTYLINYCLRIHDENFKKQFNEVQFLSRWIRRPSRFGIYIPQKLASYSPERFIQIHDDLICTEPIKGTAKNDPYLLWDSEKEMCEQTMVVDLLRNDLNQVCHAGSVKVKDAFFIREHAGLLQMQSTICGYLNAQLQPNYFEKLLPAGSITGTPKTRTMQIIQQTEKQERGLYTGVCGWKLHKNQLDSCLLIRSFFGGEIPYIGVDAGITVCSDPIAEVQELQTKIESFV